MMHTRNENPTSSRNSWLRILMAMAAATTVSANAMPRKYVIAGVYPTRSDSARVSPRYEVDIISFAGSVDANDAI